MTVGILVSAGFRIMVVSRLPEDAFLVAGIAGILVISVASAGLGEEFTAVLFYVLGAIALRSEEHTSELQSLMRISYAVFRLHTKNNNYGIRAYTTCINASTFH